MEERLTDHKNKAYSNSYTKAADDWQLYFEMGDLEYEIARKIEDHIKSMKSKNYILNLRKYPEMTSKLLIKFSNPDK